MKNFLTSMLFLAWMLVSVVPSQAQSMNHLPGEVLVQLTPNANLNALQERLRLLDGQATGFFNKGLLSAPMRIWHFGFDPDAVPEQRFLDYVYGQPEVQVAQFNHTMTERETIPDDPLLGSQWQWVNDGGSGATNDADVDADLAWDVTTGGFTANGDEIVVCVVEGGGSNAEHPDLIDNAWFNLAEIPNNNMDDDNNGYVDDYRGWNPNGNNDNIGSGNHGTSVSGMIGAKGNNDLGVTGINWDIKIMQVRVGQLSESNVIASYTYPLVMRQRYNETAGQEGAFVVSINSSWGIDGGDPNGAPLWCAFYDTLGVYGIISCGATANVNWDIDQQGDLPTACPSEYLISVTATNANDLRTFSAYGLEHVDVAAPGGGIFTTEGNSGYGSTSGTSFASPLTAGLVALLYSAPCTDLADLALSNPAAAASLVRSYILQGVDPVASLDGLIATGGRVNAFTSLQLLLASCGGTVCSEPQAINLTEAESDQATIEWTYPFDAEGFLVRYRLVGAPDWTEVEVAEPNVVLSGLEQCMEYELQLATQCSADTTSAFTQSFLFNSDCVCEAPMMLDSLDVMTDGLTLTWENSLNADSYVLRYRPLTSAVWIEVPVFGNTATLDSLEECTNYRFQIRTLCPVAESLFSTQLDLKTDCAPLVNDLTSLASDFGIWAYPSPVRDQLMIEVRLPQEGALELRLLDRIGRVLHTSSREITSPSLQTIDWSEAIIGLPSGLYLLEARMEGQTIMKKVVVE